MKLYEVTFEDRGTGNEFVVEVEARNRQDAERQARAVWARPGYTVTRVKDTLFRSATETR